MLQEHSQDYWQDADEDFWQDPASSPDKSAITPAGSPAKTPAVAQHSPDLSASQAAPADDPAEMSAVALHLSQDSGSQSVSADGQDKAVQTGAVALDPLQGPASMPPGTEQQKGFTEGISVESVAAPALTSEASQKQEQAVMEAADVESEATPAYQVSFRTRMIEQNKGWDWMCVRLMSAQEIIGDSATGLQSVYMCARLWPRSCGRRTHCNHALPYKL